MKDIIVRGETVTLNLTTKHFASEQWMDWEEDGKKLANEVKKQNGNNSKI